MRKYQHLLSGSIGSNELMGGATTANTTINHNNSSLGRSNFEQTKDIPAQ